MWTCRDPISLNIGTRFSLILGTRWWFSLIVGTRVSILGTRIGSLKRLKKTLIILLIAFVEQKLGIIFKYGANGHYTAVMLSLFVAIIRFQHSRAWSRLTQFNYSTAVVVTRGSNLYWKRWASIANWKSC